MPTLIVHANSEKHQRKLAKKLGFDKIKTYKNNPHTLVVDYKEKDAKKTMKILDSYQAKKPEKISVIKTGHELDGHIRSYVRIDPDGVMLDRDGFQLDRSGSRVSGSFVEPRSVGSRVPPNSGNLPATLAAYYSFPTQRGSAPKIAIISLGGTYLTKDLTTFWRTYMGKSGSPNVSFVNKISGSSNKPNSKIKNGDGSDENALDIEIVMGICPAAKITVYFGTNSLAGFYNAIARAISDGNKIVSISWGAPESSFGTQNVNIYNQLFQYAAQRGVIITVASGDNGATDGTNALTVDFPSSSPYVVACGGTSLSSPESTWSFNSTYGWGGGGGLSRIFNNPARSGSVIYPSLGSTTPNIDDLITSVKRSVPDVALNANPLTGWSIYFNGRLYVSTFGGTSCVSPAVAGFFGLVNKNFGSRNPIDALYAAYTSERETCYKDILAGTNNNLSGGVNVYVAHSGFDQCTGMGSFKGVGLANFITRW